jgi:hypothetical protein
MKSPDRYNLPTDEAFPPEEFGLRSIHSTIDNRHSKQKTTFFWSSFVNITLKNHLNSEYSNHHFTISSISKMILDVEVIIFLNFLSYRKKTYL